MLPLVLSSFFASVLHILRGDCVSDKITSCRDIDTYILRTCFYTSAARKAHLGFKYTNTWYSTFTPYVPFCVYS